MGSGGYSTLFHTSSGLEVCICCCQNLMSCKIIASEVTDTELKGKSYSCLGNNNVSVLASVQIRAMLKESRGITNSPYFLNKGYEKPNDVVRHPSCLHFCSPDSVIS